MKKILLTLLTALSFSGIALASSDDVLGCWSSKQRTGEHIYFTRDGRFIYTKVNASGKTETLKGEWKFKKGVSAMHLKFDDRPMVKLLLQEEKGDGRCFVSKSADMKLYFTDIKECE